MLTVIPAYGRDYTSKAQIQADWDANKDFIIQDMSSPYDGKYINKTNTTAEDFGSLKVRYNKLRNIVVIKL